MKKFLLFCLVIVSCLAIVSMVGCGLFGSSSTSSVSTFGTGGGVNAGTVSGQITNFYTGAAISNAAVLVGTKETATDSSGNYSVSGATAGTIEVSAAKSGYCVMTMKVNAATVNMTLIPTTYAKGTLHGSLKNAAGSLISGYVGMSNGKIGSSASSQGTIGNGYYFNSSSPVGNVIVSLDYGGISSTAAYSTVTLAEGGSEEVNLVYATAAQCGTLSGSITTPSGYIGPFVNNYIINKNPGLFNLLHGICFLGIGAINNAAYSLSQPATGADRVFATFALAATGSATTPEAYSFGASLVSINAGESKTHNFTLPEVLTPSAPADQATGAGTTPTFSWTCPWANSPSGYVVVLYSSGFTWYGFSNDSSITYPAFSGTFGNLQAGTTYSWYPVAGKATGVDNINSVDLTNFPIETFSTGKTRTFNP